MIRLLFMGLYVFLSARSAAAAQLAVTIADGTGAFVGNAVIALYGETTGKVAARTATPRTAALDQVNKQFVPHVLAIAAGTSLNFPNSDNIRHQVYSFSEAKRFESKLYAGKTASPVLFDVPGVVVLGCNIHDWMSAYVYVLDTPYFAMTDANGYALLDAPPGRYTLKIWHPRHERGREPQVSVIDVAPDGQRLKQSLPLVAADDSSGIPPT